MPSSAEKVKAKRKRWKQLGLCSGCGKEREDKAFLVCAACREKSKAMGKKRALSRKANSLCTKCGDVLDPSSALSTCDSCAAIKREDRKQRLSAIRDELFELYGYQCNCCGEQNPLFLTIDHILGTGAQERKVRNLSGSKGYLQYLKDGKRADLQLLCYNCNCGKYRNGGICPHVA